MTRKTLSSRKSKGPGLFAVLFELLPAFLLCALFASVGVMHASSRLMVVKVGYELSKLDHESRTLARQNDALKLELATLKNPSRLERLAREKLGMGPPPAGAVLTLDSKAVGNKALPAVQGRR